MLASTLTAAVVGVEAHLVRVEADSAPGFPKFTMVGLPDSAVKEAEGRIRAAVRNCGFEFRWDRRITVNFAPASLRKVGSSYDLAIAMGLLAAEGVIPAERVARLLLVGELALDGSVRAVAGVLPMALLARTLRLDALLAPLSNAAEASWLGGLEVQPVASLPDAVAIASRVPRPPPPPPTEPHRRAAAPALDLSDVRGQVMARRALEVAAAGGHHLLMVGPPGSGKTMLAERLPGLLPPLTMDEGLEVSAIHSAAGLGSEGLPWVPPFRNPHHTASEAALVGGGAIPRPGEISLAHRGVLFLDELPEFRRAALDALRQPLEEGSVTISRARAAVRMPARFQLVAAMNPCPCGYFGSELRPCKCGPTRAGSYQARVSGPLLDRIDLHVETAPVSYAELSGEAAESSGAVRNRVLAARTRQEARRAETRVATNAALPPAALRKVAQTDEDGRRLLARAVGRGLLTPRSHDRVLRVARTIADLAAEERLHAAHIAEAIQFRDVARGD